VSKEMREVYIVGTHHKNQFGPCNEFHSFLRAFCIRKEIRVVAEEMNNDALIKQGVKDTIPRQIARELSLAHCNCDPDESKQAELGIENGGLIKIKGLNAGLTQDQIQMQIAKEDRKREPFWLEEISQLSEFPVLFVCGSNHVSSFTNLLVEATYQCFVVTDYWTPNH
jgi:hypothetical protein